MTMSRWALLPPSSRICSCRGANVVGDRRPVRQVRDHQPFRQWPSANCGSACILRPTSDMTSAWYLRTCSTARSKSAPASVASVAREAALQPAWLPPLQTQDNGSSVSAPARSRFVEPQARSRTHPPRPSPSTGKAFVQGGLWGRYSAARFGVNSSGKPLWPVSLSPSSYISKARFFTAGRAAAICSGSRSAAMPG
jgi:hypothetical protein